MKRSLIMLKVRHNRLLKYERRLTKKGFYSIAGVDEAGRGPLAGPVVAGAVILGKRRFLNRIDDSKKLSHKKRELAFKEIIDSSVVGIGIVDEKEIDRINIYQAAKKAMEIAIKSLPTPPDYVIVDGNMKPSTKFPRESIIKGDAKSLSIAAASIIAKVTRDRLMCEFDAKYPKYGFAKHKGYGTKSHRTAIKEHGPCPIHRRTFRLI